MGNYHARFYEGLGRGDTPCLLSVGNNSQLTYDGMDHCVKIVETTGGSVTSTKQFIWCNGEMCEARDASGAITARYFDDGQTIGGSNYFYSKDHLQSIRDMLDGSGNITAHFAYDPYGRGSLLQGSLLPDFQFAHYYVHERSGLNLTQFRAYSARLGRWISREPMSKPMDTNLYNYVFNDPITLRDPSGLFPISPPPTEWVPDTTVDRWRNCPDYCKAREANCPFERSDVDKALSYNDCLANCLNPGRKPPPWQRPFPPPPDPSKLKDEGMWDFKPVNPGIHLYYGVPPGYDKGIFFYGF